MEFFRIRFPLFLIMMEQEHENLSHNTDSYIVPISCNNMVFIPKFIVPYHLHEIMTSFDTISDNLNFRFLNSSTWTVYNQPAIRISDGFNKKQKLNFLIP